MSYVSTQNAFRGYSIYGESHSALAQPMGMGVVCAYGEEVEGSREVSRVPAPRDAKPNQPVEEDTQAQHQEVPKQTRQSIRKYFNRKCRDVPKQVRYTSRKYLNR
jgi:hypothetical protein